MTPFFSTFARTFVPVYVGVYTFVEASVLAIVQIIALSLIIGVYYIHMLDRFLDSEQDQEESE